MHKQEYLKLVTCTICNEKFASLVQLQHHKIEQHFLHLCYYCDKTYSTPYDLCVHNLQEHGDTHFFLLQISPANFPLQSKLQRDLAIYSHQNPVSYDGRTDLPGTSIINIPQTLHAKQLHVDYSAPLSDQHTGQNVVRPSRICTCNDILATNCGLHSHSPQPRED